MTSPLFRSRVGNALALAVLAGWLASALAGPPPANPHPKEPPADSDHDIQVPRTDWMTPFKDEQPIVFLNRSQNPALWDSLPGYWTEFTEPALDPITGQSVMRKAVRIKVPLGLTTNPPIPAENPMSVQRWALGKRLYFAEILSSDQTVSCATCHDPKRGYTDGSSFSTGIRGLRGKMSAPTVINSAYNALQFWDGRADSLEEQAQGPVQNGVEMFDGEGHAWYLTIQRLRARPEMVKQFRAAFGTDPTRDAVAKAIACYERTVLAANSLDDRAQLAMRKRVDAEDTGKYELKAKDYVAVVQAAFAEKDASSLKSLGLDLVKDESKAAEVGKSIYNGRVLFFGKARCNACHVGDNWTDNGFHNLGVGARDGKLPVDQWGRFGAQAVGHKNPALIGAFKTPTLRHLVGTAPYLHDGSEPTLEKVVDFYDRGGNPNAFLDPNLRDVDAERAYLKSRRDGTPYQGPPVVLCGQDQTPIVPRKLGLTEGEKKDLVLFLRALQGDPVDLMVSDPQRYPK